MLDGELRTGATGSAGEVGYLPIAGLDGARRAVRAAQPGPFEAQVAAEGLVRAAKARGLRVRTAEEVVAAARGGDADAAASLEELARLLAAGIATVCAIVDPGLVVLGGGLGVGASDLLLPLLHKDLRRLTPLRPTVAVSELGDHAVLDGAVVDAVPPPRRPSWAPSPATIEAGSLLHRRHREVQARIHSSPRRR